MPKRIYVGNLPFMAEESDIRKLVSSAGEVESVELKRDKANDSAMAAIVFTGEGPKSFDGIAGESIGGRRIVVSDDRNVVVNHEEQ